MISTKQPENSNCIADQKNYFYKSNIIMLAPFKIIFSNVSEIRMGSPYNTCHIKFSSDADIKLPSANSWQDKYAWSEDYSKLVLVKWNIENNIPGFRLWIVEIKTKKEYESPRFSGLLNELRIEKNTIHFTKFFYNKERSTQGNLCCSENEHFIIPDDWF